MDKNCSCRKSRSAFTDFFRKLTVVKTSEKNDIYSTSAPAKSLGTVQSLKMDFRAARGCVSLDHFNKNLPLIKNEPWEYFTKLARCCPALFLFLTFSVVFWGSLPPATFVCLTFKGPKAFGSFSRKLQSCWRNQMVDSEIFLSDVSAIVQLTLAIAINYSVPIPIACCFAHLIAPTCASPLCCLLKAVSCLAED